MNPVLASLLAQRAEQTTYADQLLSRISEENRDMVDAERSNLNATRERIAQLDEQISDLEAFEATRAAHQESSATALANVRATHGGSTPPAGGQSLGVTARDRAVEYRSPGHFVVDYLRARGDESQNRLPDADAAQRVASALGRAANDVPAGNLVTTADHAGLLPEPIIGAILTQLDGSRPFLSSIGIKPLDVVPGKTFERPKVVQSTSVAEQTAELGELTFGDFKVDGVSFTKKVFGGALRVSRQDIDWTSPAAWNALIEDLQFEYAEETEDIVAAAFATGVTQSQEIAAADVEKLPAWIKALYLAATKAATAGGTKRARARRLPNIIWTSIDMWAQLGAVIDAVRAENNSQISAGTSSVMNFMGSILDAPRVMVPGFESGTMIVGRKEQFEFYEERIGLLSAITPVNLGVQVAYGGYGAWGNMDATAFSKVEIAAA
ncbi:MAG: phage major capsid protein [Actinobacteria bacterium HGW-Actinobacteria-6]|nr:MAG: phage major capsid protein [Actinobacteria bacterium HGW-Actinobacteria-6]